MGTNPNQRKLFFKKGAKNVYLQIPNKGKSMYTVLMCASADRTSLGPLVVYKGKNIYNTWTENGPQNAFYACTESGWMEHTVFKKWFTTVFIKHINENNIQRPAVLMYDGHGSHLTYQTVISAMENHVIIIALPPHTTHALQPLDVGLFKPLKTQWRKILLQFFREARMKSVHQAIFPTLLKQLMETNKSEYLVNGFRGAGLWPLNKDAARSKFTDGNGSSDIENDPDLNEPSPHKKLCVAIMNTIAPNPSEETEKALAN